MKKKIIALSLVLVLALIAVIGGTMAYFTDSASETNVITIGNVSAELYESKYHRGATGDSYLKITGQPEPLTDDDIIADFETYQSEYLADATLMPFNFSGHRNQAMFEACTVAKNAYVKNTGSVNDCFVRVRYLIPADVAQYLDIFYVGTQFIDAADEVATADATTLNNDDKPEPVITSVNTTAANFVAQVGEANKKVIDGTEYYYADFIYAERLTPGEMTLYSPISKITMVPSVTNEIAEAIAGQARQFDIVVEAEVIQADGFLNALEAFAAYDAE